MRCFVFVLLALGLVAKVFSAQSPEVVLREIGAAARTNTATALILCDKAVADYPTNSQPLIVRARVLDSARRYPEAIRDLSAALKMEPKFLSLWQTRGEVHFKAGNFKESVADFDRVIELSPDRAPHHWQRGISLYYARQFSDGRKQFELHQTVNSSDVENAVWHFLCAAREQGVTNARASMIKVGPDGRVPMQEIYALYADTGNVDAVTSAAASSRSRDALFYANLYLGLYFEAVGNAAKARQHIAKAAVDPGATHYMGDVARVHWKLIQSAASQ
ncbi:MAG TPA: tetratricopeptide repeat protein [Candidatus Limnocylindria bacterium]|nr:tetratricopeptide repeat protein [Candidatus Limnocylindria bacterium]